MRRAAEAGYKVYLYFVSTESPDINVERVQIRVRQGGHDVPEEKIRERYCKSLALLYDAIQLAYHGFLFDNSASKSFMFAEFKRTNGARTWSPPQLEASPLWFQQYYFEKQGGL